MRRLAYLVHFFVAVPPVPPALIGAFAASIFMAAAAMMTGQGGRNVLAPLFLLQLLSASSGVAMPARRGHYDLLLTSGGSRLSMGLMHCAVSIAPGMLSWCAVAAFEMALPHGAGAFSLSSGTVVAMVAVSVLAWATTAPFPRLTGGVAWLVLVAGAYAVAPEGWWGSWPSAVICPWLLVGQRLSAGDLPLVLALAGCTAAALAASLLWMTRMDVPLEAPS